MPKAKEEKKKAVKKGKVAKYETVYVDGEPKTKVTFPDGEVRVFGQ